MQSLLREQPGSTPSLAKPNPEVLARWEVGPSWNGGSWRDFFVAFTACADLSQPGLTVTQLSEVASERANSDILAASEDKVRALMLLKNHQWVHQIRRALDQAIEDGLVVKLGVEDGLGLTHEYYALNPNSRELYELMSSPSAASLDVMADPGVEAVSTFQQIDLNELARAQGFTEGSSLSARQLIQWFRDAGAFTMTEALKSQALWPLGVSYFTSRVTLFIEAVIQTAVDSKVLEEIKSEDGRPMYQLSKAVAALHQL